jgi:predicted transcriptional regulator
MNRKSLLIRLDEDTTAALNCMAAGDNRKLKEFIRAAIRQAIRRAGFRSIRRAYRKQPDSSREAGNWSTVEDFTGSACPSGPAKAAKRS